MEQLIVPQEHGKDSIVEITEDVVDRYPSQIKILRFYTSQSLVSNSGRAWNVREAIKNYCREHGYRIEEETQHEIAAAYSSREHSYYAADKLRKAVQEDGRYQAAVADGKKMAREIQLSTYGPALSILKKAIAVLEKEAREELAQIAERVARTQEAVLAELDLPDYLLEPERSSLHRPMYHPELDHYTRHAVSEEDVDTVLAILID